MIITAQFDGFILFIFMSPSFSNWGHIYLVSNLSVSPVPCADPGIFVRGGPAGQSDKKALTTFFFFFFFFFFFTIQLILQKSNGQFHRSLSFSRFQRGSNIFQGGGGSNFFQGGQIAYPL